MGLVDYIAGVLWSNSTYCVWAISLSAFVVAFHYLSHRGSKTPASLPNVGIPFVGNTYQYVMDNLTFLSRARLVQHDSPQIYVFWSID
jgi:hypothetical protein